MDFMTMLYQFSHKDIKNLQFVYQMGVIFSVADTRYDTENN